MKHLDFLMKLMGCVLKPIGKNAAFFVFMYLLGYTCIKVGTPYYAQFGFVELFIDLYMLCVVLALIPWRVRRWVRALLYVLLYTTSIVDMYCIVKFNATFSPTMLLLVGETTGREAAEFLGSYVGWDLLGSNLVWLLLILLIHIIYSVAMVVVRGRHYTPRIPRRALLRLRLVALPLLGAAVLVLIERGAGEPLQNKVALVRMMSYTNVGDVEREFNRKDGVKLYLPIYRFAYSFLANELAARQVDQLIRSARTARVDSCAFTTPNIVLIIGESYNRHHSQLYGYDKPTTPRQVRRSRRETMAVFTDVVAPFNLTSFVFKNIFSLNVLGEKGDWCDYPLFPELFRAAGYRVTFVTNQFRTRTTEAVYDFSGGFFLNHPELSRAMFDVRNERTHRFDRGVIDDYDRLLADGRLSFDGKGDHNLVILHLMGQHVNYRDRSPRDRKKFTAGDYRMEGYSQKERAVVADYDNATLYNDSVVDQLVRRFEDKEALVIYLSDHGDECYGMGCHKFGRTHSDNFGYRVAHEEFEIPFWVWCSRTFAKRHPELVEQLMAARDRPYMTDCLPHLLLYLGGIATPQYRERYNVLSPHYDVGRRRMLKNKVDYDELRRNYEAGSAGDGPADRVAH